MACGTVTIIIVIINNTICLRHMSSNKANQRHITVYYEYTDYFKIKNRDIVVK